MRNQFVVFLLTLLIVGFSSCKKEVINPQINSNAVMPLDTASIEDKVSGKYFVTLNRHCGGDACHDASDYNGNGTINIASIGDSITFYGMMMQGVLAYAGYDKNTSRYHYNYYTGNAYLDTFYYRDKCDAYFNLNGDSLYIISTSNHDGMCNSWASGAKIH